MRLAQLFRMAAVLLPVFFSSIIYSQNNKSVNDLCTADSNCAPGLYCVTVTVQGQTKTVCSKCNQGRLGTLTEKVDEACKNRGRGTLAYADIKAEFDAGSEKDVSLLELEARKNACKECLTARLAREGECWNGGDPGHQQQITEMNDAISWLDRLISDKKYYKLAYYCDQSTYNTGRERIEDDCEDIDEIYKKYISDGPSEVLCSDIEDVVEGCEDCKKAYENMLYYCFKDGFSDPLKRRYEKIIEMQRIAKETYDKRKSDGTCK